MSVESRTRGMTDRLPIALSEGRVVRALLRAFASELETGDQLLFRLFRSRHLTLADAWGRGESVTADDAPLSDLARLGTLLGQTPYPDESPSQFRTRLSALMAVHRAGLGTAEAILRLVALNLRTEQPIKLSVERRGSDWVSLASARLRMRDGVTRSIVLELHDNPSRPERLTTSMTTGAAEVTVKSESAEETAVSLTLEPQATLLCPVLVNERALLLFGGRVEAHERLQLLADGPRRNGFASAEPFVALQLATAPASLPDGKAAGVVGLWSTLLTNAIPSTPARALRLPPGDSRWQVAGVPASVAQTILTLVDSRLTLSGLKGNEKATALKLSLTFDWQSRVAACFTVRYPDVLPFWTSSREEVLHAVRKAVDYGRAAGIRGQLQQRVPLTESIPTVQERRPRLSLQPQDSLALADRMTSRVSLTLPEPYRTHDRGSRRVDFTRLDQARFDDALLGRAGEAAFDSGEHQDAARLDYDSFADATPAMLGVAVLDRDAFAWEGEQLAPGMEAHLRAQLQEPLPSQAPPLRLDDPKAGLLDAAAFAQEPPTRFEAADGNPPDPASNTAVGLVLDHAALGFGLTPGVLGRARFGQAGFSTFPLQEPPEGWPDRSHTRTQHIEIQDDLTKDLNSDAVETGEDNG